MAQDDRVDDTVAEANSVLDLVDIVEKASSLSERLSGVFVPKDPVNDEILAEIEAEIEAELQRWCMNAARGNWENFKKRLSWDDLDIDTLRPMLGPMQLADGQQLP